MKIEGLICRPATAQPRISTPEILLRQQDDLAADPLRSQAKSVTAHPMLPSKSHGRVRVNNCCISDCFVDLCALCAYTMPTKHRRSDEDPITELPMGRDFQTLLIALIEIFARKATALYWGGRPSRLRRGPSRPSSVRHGFSGAPTSLDQLPSSHLPFRPTAMASKDRDYSALTYATRLTRSAEVVFLPYFLAASTAAVISQSRGSVCRRRPSPLGGTSRHLHR